MKRNSQGFTVIELLIVLAIIGIISAVVLFNHTSFTDALEVKTAADTVLLSFREAQVEGLATRETESNGEFKSGYGVFIDHTDLGGFIYFADSATIGTQKKYDAGEEIKQEDFLYGVEIDPAETCGYFNNGGSADCLSDNHDIQIVFSRPRPNPTIKINGDQEYDYVSIYLVSNEQRDAEIVIQKSGQVSVDYIPE